MSWLSTYTQTISVDDGIYGKTLKDRFLEDGVLVPDPEEGKYVFDQDKINLAPDKIKRKGICYNDLLKEDLTTDCFSEDGNKLSCIFFSQKADASADFLQEQISAMHRITELYPEVPFHLDSSYCPGGGGERTTAICMDITYHAKTNSWEIEEKGDMNEEKELREEKLQELRDELEEQLRGDCFMDYISKSDWMDTLYDFDKWAEKAQEGEVYFYGGREYRLSYREEKTEPDSKPESEREEILAELRKELNASLYGDCTESEWREVMADFDEWSKTAEEGDVFTYAGEEYCFTKERDTERDL